MDGEGIVHCRAQALTKYHRAYEQQKAHLVVTSPSPFSPQPPIPLSRYPTPPPVNMNPFRPPTPDTPQWKDAFRLSITSYRACPNERLIVVLGINGRQGASVAKAFRRDPGWRIRGLTSELNSEMSKRWESCGVEVQKVDTNDLASMITAFRGASAVFAVTDYYKHLDDHSVHTLASLTSKSREEVAGDRDYQAQHVILQAAAVTTTLMRLILSSLPDASGIYPTLRGRQQMLSKKAVAKSIWTTYPHLAVKTAIVEPCLRMEDFRVTYRRVSRWHVKHELVLTWVTGRQRDIQLRDHGSALGPFAMDPYDERLRYVEHYSRALTPFTYLTQASSSAL